MSSATYYQSVIDAVWVNDQKKPFGDSRVRRAMHLVLDRYVLQDVVKDMAPYLVGGFVYPFSQSATLAGNWRSARVISAIRPRRPRKRAD